MAKLQGYHVGGVKWNVHPDSGSTAATGTTPRGAHEGDALASYHTAVMWTCANDAPRHPPLGSGLIRYHAALGNEWRWPEYICIVWPYIEVGCEGDR